MTQAQPTNYWVSPSALFIQLNAAGDRNYIHANCASGSMVMCYMKGITGLEYDNAHNYRRWPLIASPTVFHDNNKRWVYIAIPKSTAADAQAQVVFSPQEIDLYGQNEEGTQIGPADFYYIYTQGIISASSDGGVLRDRTWEQQFNNGSLASDEAIASGGEGTWWEYNATTNMVKFLKTISEAVFEKLTASWASITTLVLGGKTLKFVAGDDTAEDAEDSVVTPKWLGQRYLSRTHDDTAQGAITILKAVTVGNFEKDIQVGIGSRDGARILPDGTIIARSLELSQSLSVPTIKYNQIEVLSGTRWDSAGKGRVKEIIDVNQANHTCQFVLDLNDGEPGEFIIGDILRGFWSNMDGSKNATANSDDHHGNIQRAGFMSIYCRVQAVGDVVERVIDDTTYYIAKDARYSPMEGDKIYQNGLVTVVMRKFDTEEGEPEVWSPAPEQWSVLSVSGSFDNNHPERQAFFVYTTTYMARFQGVNTWEWEDHCFMGGWGDLTGFTMLVTDDEGQTIHRKEFNGESFVTKDAYIYGVIEQLTRFSDKVEIVLSNPDGTIASDEQIRADFVLKDVSGQVIQSGYQMTITRQSGNSAADAAWDAAIAHQYPDGIPSALYFRYSDVPELGAVFVVAASRTIHTEDGDQVYTTSASFLLTRAVIHEVFMGEWDPTVTYTRTSRAYPTITYGGCKWYLNANSSTNDEPYPGSSVWKMLYGVADLTIRFYDANAQLITTSAQIPGQVDLYLDPRLFCGNFDITSQLTDSDWAWERYTGNYGEETDTRTAADKQSDQGWRNAHWPEQPMTRTIRIRNADMPPTWPMCAKVNFIVTATYDGLEIPNIVSF